MSAFVDLGDKDGPHASQYQLILISHSISPFTPRESLANSILV